MGPVVVEATLAAYDLRPLITGNWELLTPNHWGVIAGIATFTVTVTVVLVLVILGGTCSRLRDEAQEYEVKGVAAFKAPYQRFQLYDELLIAVATLPSKPSLSLLPQMGGKEMTGGSKRLDGLTVELHAYEPALHLDQLWAISCGKPVYAYGPFDPEECLWRFFDVGAPSSEVQTSATTDNASVIHSENNTSGAANQSNVAAATTSTSPALTPPKEPTGIAGYASRAGRSALHGRPRPSRLAHGSRGQSHGLHLWDGELAGQPAGRLERACRRRVAHARVSAHTRAHRPVPVPPQLPVWPRLPPRGAPLRRGRPPRAQGHRARGLRARRGAAEAPHRERLQRRHRALRPDQQRLARRREEPLERQAARANGDFRANAPAWVDQQCSYRCGWC